MIKAVIADTLHGNYAVLVATPTVKLADTYKMDFPEITCTSIHSAFAIPVKETVWKIN